MRMHAISSACAKGVCTLRTCWPSGVGGIISPLMISLRLRVLGQHVSYNAHVCCVYNYACIIYVYSC